MAEDSDLSRTEPASPRRLLEARRNGDVPRSGELGAWLALSAALAALSWLAPPLFAGLGRVMQASLQSSAHDFPTSHLPRWSTSRSSFCLFLP
jgi:Flagellar biosynthesis pathway, component FlhB